MCSEEVKKGGEFQDYVVKLLYRSGFSEGEIYSTGSKGYYEKTIVFPGSIDAVTSPDILILDWARSAGSLIRFGIECMRRDKLFDINGQKYLTCPAHKWVARALLSIIVLTKENIDRMRRKTKSYAELPEGKLWEQLKKFIARWISETRTKMRILIMTENDIMEWAKQEGLGENRF